MIGEAVEFAPIPQAEPQREREFRRPRPPAPAEDADPAVAAFWHALGDSFAAVVAPGLRLLAGVIGDPGDLTQPDL